jgi:ATP-dependent helicase/nuclease subunit A
MQQRLQAKTLHLDHSWRSSPVVIDFVNRVFTHPPVQQLLSGFQPHTTHRSQAWGRVEVWPLFAASEPSETSAADGLRNPLREPRTVSLDDRHYREGQAIATRIQELVARNIAGYDDMILLMRSRTHLSDYEAALRDAGIPYLSLDRGTLLHSLEIRDLEALLTVLMTPQDNLSLAQVLRSPIFSATDDDLVVLAQESAPSWFERLTVLASRLQPDHRLHRAARLLSDWRVLAGHVPIHDLLEHIFHESNLPERYAAAFPAVQSARVRANLTRFIELALEVDAGRYPTLPRFLERVRQLRTLDKEGPNQATPHAADGQRVCLLTIHAAKGLEAPVVFLADSTNPGNTPPGCQTLVTWPAESDRPTRFMLLGTATQRDSASRALYEQEQAEQQRESANLLYVALTRARHMLVMSGCAASRGGVTAGWYQQVCDALDHDAGSELAWCAGDTQARPRCTDAPSAHPEEPDIPAVLREPLEPRSPWQEIAPSRRSTAIFTDDADAEGRLRGTAIHRMIQLASESPPTGLNAQTIIGRVAAELQGECSEEFLRPLWSEVAALFADPRLAWLLVPTRDTRAYNEVPIQYRLNGKTVYGIIDRLLVSQAQTWIIDYKSHSVTDEARLLELTEHFRPQLELYAAGARRLWPDRDLRVFVLFTATRRLVEID